ncbi:MAG: alpha/beta hydrolase [Planctomycetes bacterium]|nr:alpha/beta hydrolase [Planctomycetota bacterium]
MHRAATGPQSGLGTRPRDASLYPPVALSLNVRAGEKPRTAIIVAHPGQDRTQHFTVKPFAEAGLASIGVSTRFGNNDTYLTMEAAVLDIGGAVRFAREQGFERVALFGHSGGGPLMAFYQSQAERPTVTSTPAGDPPDLREADLVPADALVLCAAIPGRAQALTELLDPAVVDERDPFATDTGLDMFNPEHGPPYGLAFQERYRRAQLARNERITRWAWAKLAELRARADGACDLQFPVYRTTADLRFLDPSIDPNDREVGLVEGDPRRLNLSGRGLASCSSVRSWLSQWSVSATQADGIAAARTISRPALVITLGADQRVFPSHLQSYFDAIPRGDKAQRTIRHAPHRLDNLPDQCRELATIVADWLDR